MLSPYSLARPGGVQGQVIGLARSLRARGHDVTVLAPGTAERRHCRPPWGSTSSSGDRPGCTRTARWRRSRSRRWRRCAPSASSARGGFDVLHVHEPLAPMAAYGLVLTDPLPMVGTYHRSGVSRWVAPLKPLAELVGRRMQVRVAVSEAARDTGSHAGGGTFEVLFNGIDMDRFESAPPRRDEDGRPVVRVPRSPRAAQGSQRAARRLRQGGAAGRPVGHRRRPGRRGAAPPPSRVGPRALARRLRRRRGGGPAGRARTCCAPRRCSASRSAWSCSRAWRRAARWWPRTSTATGAPPAATPRSVPPGDVDRPVPGARAARSPMPRRAAGWPRPRRTRRRRSTPGRGRWTHWPSATSACTSGRSSPSAPDTDPGHVAWSPADQERAEGPHRQVVGCEASWPINTRVRGHHPEVVPATVPATAAVGVRPAAAPAVVRAAVAPAVVAPAVVAGIATATGTATETATDPRERGRRYGHVSERGRRFVVGLRRGRRSERGRRALRGRRRRLHIAQPVGLGRATERPGRWQPPALQVGQGHRREPLAVPLGLPPAQRPTPDRRRRGAPPAAPSRSRSRPPSALRRSSPPRSRPTATVPSRSARWRPWCPPLLLGALVWVRFCP